MAKDTIKSLLAFAGNYAQKYSTGKDNFLSFDGLIDLVQGKYSEEEKVNKNPLVKVVKLALNCEDSPATNAEGWIKESCKQKQWKKFAESEELWKAMHVRSTQNMCGGMIFETLTHFDLSKKKDENNT